MTEGPDYCLGAELVAEQADTPLTRYPRAATIAPRRISPRLLLRQSASPIGLALVWLNCHDEP